MAFSASDLANLQMGIRSWYLRPPMVVSLDQWKAVRDYVVRMGKKSRKQSFRSHLMGAWIGIVFVACSVTRTLEFLHMVPIVALTADASAHQGIHRPGGVHR